MSAVVANGLVGAVLGVLLWASRGPRGFVRRRSARLVPSLLAGSASAVLVTLASLAVVGDRARDGATSFAACILAAIAVVLVSARVPPDL